MRGPRARLFDHIDWKGKKGCATVHVPQISCFQCPQMSCFHCKYQWRAKKKEVFVVRDEAPHFPRGPRLQPA